MSRKQLAILLSKLKPFENPKINLEQYPSDSEEISKILWQAYMFGHIEGKMILDAGCGTGIIGIGAMLLDAKKVIFLDVDTEALDTLKKNISLAEELCGEKIKTNSYEIINSDYLTYDFSGIKIDTIIHNPPFGTRNEHSDLNFLKKSFSVANAVYSLHKASTKNYLQKAIERESFRIFYEYEFSYPLKNTYTQHTKKIQRIESICFGCEKNK
jgi:putative methylase